MTNIHRTGPVMPKQFPVKLTLNVKTNDIAVGNLVAFESGKIVPADVFPFTVDIATTRLAFAAAFAGIASGASDKDLPLDTRDENVLVTQDGEIEFDAAADTYLVGDLLTVKKAVGNALTHTVEKSVIPTASIAIVSITTAAGATRVRGYLQKTLPKRV